jgi:ribosomal protein S18 acetylase RimI-like enzyme
VDVIDAPGRDHLIDDAAQIWAEATAARDGDDEVPGLDVSRPVIQSVLDRSSRALLLIARSADGTAAGFAVIEPLGGRNEAVAEVSYVGVRPRLWGQGVGERLLLEGQGVGERLLLEIGQRLKTAGYASVELSVYVDNRRATALYERVGWLPTGGPGAHPRTGKPEQRYELRLQANDS